MNRKITIDEAWQIIHDLNEVAYDKAYDRWLEADRQDSDELREEASDYQRAQFAKLFNKKLGSKERSAIIEFAKDDPDLADQLDSYHP